MSPSSNIPPHTTSRFKDMITGGIIYDELVQLGQTWAAPELYSAMLAFLEQNLGSLTVDDLEDMKTFIFNLVEEIDGTIEMSESRPSVTRD
jgi:hypothetical protein